MEQSSRYLITRLLKEFVAPHKGKIAFAVCCMIVVACATAIHAWLIQPALDDIFQNKNTQMLLIIPIAVMVIAFVKGIASYGQSVIMKVMGQRVITTMQMQLYTHLLHADLALIHSQTSGKLISRFTNDIQIMRNSVTNVLTGVAKESLTLIFLIGLMFYQSVTLSLMVFVIFPVAIYPVVRLGKRMRKISNQTQEELGQFTACLDDTFQGVRVIKAYGQEDSEQQKAQTLINTLLGLYIKAARTESAPSPIMETLGGIAIASVIWYGGYQVIEGVTTQGAFFSFIAALIMAYKPMKSLAGLNTSLQEGLAAARRLFAILDIKPTIIDAANAHPFIFKGGEITLNNVSFRYNDEATALNNISLSIPAGKKVALVGPSGGGKSTIMNLILRLYDPQEGIIEIDKQDIQHVTLTSLREHMAIVSQEVTLFDDTVRANICYGKPGASDEDIIKAATHAAAHTFIQDLPQGYDTLIGQQGLRLSGGQRQRLAIARAMLRNAPILLLDEATSALDPISEKQIQEALEKLMQDRTTLVIAHRLSTVMNADIIYVVERGSIVESGTHEHLLAKGEAYSKLYKKLEF